VNNSKTISTWDKYIALGRWHYLTCRYIIR
jgi:hypothetical protein